MFVFRNSLLGKEDLEVGATPDNELAGDVVFVDDDDDDDDGGVDRSDDCVTDNDGTAIYRAELCPFITIPMSVVTKDVIVLLL